MDASCCISYPVAEAVKAGSASQALGGSPLEPSLAGRSLALLGAAVQVHLYNCDIAACVARDTFVASRRPPLDKSEQLFRKLRGSGTLHLICDLRLRHT